MEKFNKLVDLLDMLAEKYKFDDSDVQKIQELVYDVENGEDMYGEGEEYVEEGEDYGDEEEGC